MLLGVSSSGLTMKMMAMMSSALPGSDVAVKGDLQPGREAKLLVLEVSDLTGWRASPRQLLQDRSRPSDGCSRLRGGSKSGPTDPERAADSNI